MEIKKYFVDLHSLNNETMKNEQIAEILLYATMIVLVAIAVVVSIY